MTMLQSGLLFGVKMPSSVSPLQERVLNIFEQATLDLELEKAAWFEKGGKISIQDDLLIWTLNGKMHRDGDKPAFVKKDAVAIWYQHGEIHRDQDKPAYVHASGTKEWYHFSDRHRDDDEPAVIKADGTREYWLLDQRHRDNGPAVIKADGTEEFWTHGQPAE